MAGILVEGSQRLTRYMFVHVLISCKISTRWHVKEGISVQFHPHIVVAELTGRINPPQILDVPPDRPEEPKERGEDHDRQRRVEYELHVAASRAGPGCVSRRDGTGSVSVESRDVAHPIKT